MFFAKCCSPRNVFFLLLLCFLLGPIHGRAGFRLRTTMQNSRVAPGSALSCSGGDIYSDKNGLPPVTFRQYRENIREAFRAQQGQEGLQNKSNTLAWLSLAFGAGGIMSFFGFLATAALGIGAGVFLLLWPMLSIAAIITGTVAIRKKQIRGISSAGRILGIVGASLFLVVFALAVVILSSFL